MLTIRLSRTGRENLAQYRLVVQEKTQSPKSGKRLAIVGSYDPKSSKNEMLFDREKVALYLKNGAVPSDTVARLLVKGGMQEAKQFIQKYTKKLSAEAQKAKKDAEVAAKKAREEAKKAAAAEKKAADEAAAKAATEAAAAAKAAAETPAPEAEAQAA